MFKNATRYILPGPIDTRGLESERFLPCGVTQEKSIGFVPPRGGAGDDAPKASFRNTELPSEKVETLLIARIELDEPVVSQVTPEQYERLMKEAAT